MSAFTTQRYEQILKKMIAKVVTRSTLSDISDSATAKHILAAAARQDDEQYFQMLQVLQLFDIYTATGDDLDERAAEIQPAVITRNAAAKASGNLQFSRPGVAGTITIPAGTKAKTSGGQIYSTTAVGSITPGNQDSGLIPAIADAAGAAGNVVSATIIKLVTKPAGVTVVTNPAAFTGGDDKESDDSFRNRITLFINSLAKSTVDALEFYVLGAEDTATGAVIVFSKAVEDETNLGQVVLYIDDGTGSAESSALEATDLLGDYDWPGGALTPQIVPTTVTTDVEVGDFIGFRTDEQLWEVSAKVAGVSVTLLNPLGLTYPTDLGPAYGTSFVNPENVTEGLSGPPADSAVGGESRLYLDNVPVKDSLTFEVFSTTRGLLTLNTHYTLNSAAGQLVFTPVLVASEVIYCIYTYYTGLIALAQKIIDGDAADRDTYPGVRAAGVLVYVRVPAVQIQTVDATVTILDGYTDATVRTNVTEAIKTYINTLGISGDVVRNELIKRIMSVAGVYNVILTTPATDIILLDDELARTTDANVTVT